MPVGDGLQRAFLRNQRETKMKNDEPQSDDPSEAMFTVNGESKTAARWAEETGITVKTIYVRIGDGWTVEQAVKTPPNQRHNWLAKQKQRPASVVNNEKVEQLIGFLETLAPDLHAIKTELHTIKESAAMLKEVAPHIQLLVKELAPPNPDKGNNEQQKN